MWVGSRSKKIPHQKAPRISFVIEALNLFDDHCLSLCVSVIPEVNTREFYYKMSLVIYITDVSLNLKKKKRYSWIVLFVWHTSSV